MDRKNEGDIPAMVSTKSEKERIHFRATKAMVAALSELKKSYGMSMSDSIRRGVMLMLIAKRGETNNKRLALVNQDNAVVTEIELI